MVKKVGMTLSDELIIKLGYITLQCEIRSRLFMMMPWRRLLQTLGNRRFGLFVVVMVFMWVMTVINVNYSNREKESEQIKEELIELSSKYVKALARENANIVDGPFAGRFTGYDLKKTMAVLLESILGRLESLEIKVDHVLNGTTNATKVERDQPEKLLQAVDLISGKQEKCSLTDEDNMNFPNCATKLAWMRDHWKTDPCYSTYGVDGTECSFIYYLGEIENWCPKSTGNYAQKRISDQKKGEFAQINTQLEGLMELLKDPNPERANYAWVRMRITRMWGKWTSDIKMLQANQNMNGRVKKKIILYLGLLSRESHWGIVESQFKGGPLGELVQWSDLITALYILGHDLRITSEVEQLTMYLTQLPSAQMQCQVRDDLPIDMIFTDIMGLTQFKKHVKSGYGKFSCLLRIVDSFGTEPAFNHMPYASNHKMRTTWGMQNLNPKQFFTMFPHTPDNSFMGFVVEQKLNKTVQASIKKRQQAVVYGKNEYMWEGKKPYLDILHKHYEIHGTVQVDKPPSKVLPDYVINHGVLGGDELYKLLSQSKVFIGLGFPYEGPAPLEAIANGCVFINPRFVPAHSSRNNKFFQGKPTSREVTSQHPYAEEFIKEPHTYTINIGDPEEVERTIKKINDQPQVDAFLPFEFTEAGMLQRMNAYIKNQDFCRGSAIWPPESAIEIVPSSVGESCKEACFKKDLICEPSHFKGLNTQLNLEKHFDITCKSVDRQEDIFYPAYNKAYGTCGLQAQDLLFSCVGDSPDLARLCPCRNYIKQQWALCKTCL
ncbi:unnamed protein product [Owenia fusiformis]|uniref:alpha-1,6-mannosyl-glycoprotein 6-beta-N-acetylglucosaminyltransferase n=1 Tax=Owenia fusiformis TaxID=6347 RepID=A0A8S4P6P1_OWEFU|nr:unnamed protein product [Owenia fusiformis]